MYNTIIIGAGPAGISAGIYLIRAGVNVLIIENNTISGIELLNNGKQQFKNLGGTIINDEIVTIAFETNLEVIGKERYECENLIIATGASRLLPHINGLEEGPHVSFCAVCDGFFYKDKNVAVLGSGLYAITEATHLSNVTDKITLLTNNKPISNVKFLVNKDTIHHVENDKSMMVYLLLKAWQDLVLLLKK